MVSCLMGDSTALASAIVRCCPKYLFSDHHEAIIDEQTFIAVAEEKQRRCNIEVDENGVHRKRHRYTAKIKISESIKEE